MASTPEYGTGTGYLNAFFKNFEKEHDLLLGKNGKHNLIYDNPTTQVSINLLVTGQNKFYSKLKTGSYVEFSSPSVTVVKFDGRRPSHKHINKSLVAVGSAVLEKKDILLSFPQGPIHY